MTQHYPKPEDVVVPAEWWPTNYTVRKMKELIAKDGLIVPILVNEVGLKFSKPSRFVVADDHQAERVVACQALGFETILVETEWTEEDL